MCHTHAVPRTPRAIVVGSGLAGLTCAHDLAANGWQVEILTPGRAGRDGASHRVHLMAPWILLTAPWVKGDSPSRFLTDLLARGETHTRPEVCEVLADAAHEAALDLLEALDLQRLSAEPVRLPGEELPRSLRCVPRGRLPLLAPLLESCQRQGVRLLQRTLAVGLLLASSRAVGVVTLTRNSGELGHRTADAVILACGGAAAAYPRSTVSRWCRGAGLALGAAAGVLLHHANLLQSLPVTATPPGFFPTSAALLGGRVMVDGRPLSRHANLQEMTRSLAVALRAGSTVTLDSNGEIEEVLPPRLVASPGLHREGQVPLTLAAHHTVGGVAIDARGRTSLSGLYACGEAAGGAQGRRRTMGTGLIEARIFGRRAARAVVHDAPKLGPAPAPEEVRMSPLPCEPAAVEERMNDLLGPLLVVRPQDELARALAEMAAWPTQPGDAAEEAAVLAGIRLAAATAILSAEQAETSQNQHRGRSGDGEA